MTMLRNHPPGMKRNPRPGLIKTAAVIQSLYALIEITDCVTACLMALELVRNPYPKLLFNEIQPLFESQSVWLVPLFLFYTSLRATSAIGLWKNRLWGFWMTLFVSSATLIMAPFLLPFASAEMLMNGVLIILLLIGFFGDTPILFIANRNAKYNEIKKGVENGKES